MPYNGTGQYTLFTPGNPVVTGTVISSTVQNNTMNDVATALTNCVTRDGQSPPTQNLPMGGFKLTGVGAPTTTGDVLVSGQPIASPTFTGTMNAAAANFSGGITGTTAQFAGTLLVTTNGADVTGASVFRSALTLNQTFVNGVANFTRSFDGIEAGVRMPVANGIGIKWGATAGANTTGDWLFATDASSNLQWFRHNGTTFVTQLTLTTSGVLQTTVGGVDVFGASTFRSSVAVTGALTGAAISGTTVTATGVVKGGGASSLGQRLVTIQNGGTAPAGSAGDVCYIY